MIKVGDYVTVIGKKKTEYSYGWNAFMDKTIGKTYKVLAANYRGVVLNTLASQKFIGAFNNWRYDTVDVKK